MLWNLNMLQLALIPSYAASWCFLAFYTLVCFGFCLIFHFSLSTLGRDKCDALRDLVAFVQFKKREKHP